LAGSGPVPWRHLIPRVAPLMIVYFCQGWTGWLFVTWMPSLLQKNYGVEIKKSALLYMALLFSGFLAELLGGMTTDHLLHRTGSLQIARSLVIAVSWVFAVVGLLPVIFFHDMVIGVSGFMVTVFFLGFAISPLWTATMDIAPAYAGTSSSLMNASGAVAGILSPVAFAWILDLTGSWTLPFAVSVGLLLFAIVVTYWIRPDRPIDTIPTAGRLAVAGG
jgi:nitrate/nitrite transporter NarK